MGNEAQPEWHPPWAGCLVASLTVDSVGNLYMIDSSQNVVRKISPDGTTTTIAGFGVFKRLHERNRRRGTSHFGVP
jgi:hypothetical protein